MKLIGDLLTEPELHFTPSGKAVCRFTFQDLQVVAWEDLAEDCAKHFGRGDYVEIHGRKKLRTYRAFSGEVKTIEEFVLQRIRMLERIE